MDASENLTLSLPYKLIDYILGSAKGAI